MMHNRFSIAAALSILALVAGACNLPLTPVPGRTPAAVPATGNGTPAQAVPNTGAQGAAEIAVAKHGKYGDILVDGSGRTLYMFIGDGLNTPTCYSPCTKLWEPFISASGGVAVGQGVSSSLVGIVIRTGGRRQVVYNGHPLYYSSKDTAPGDINGQGMKDAWFVVSPSGDPVEK